MRRAVCGLTGMASLLLLLCGVRGQKGHGPAPRVSGLHANVGWVADHFKSTEPSATNGMLRVQGDSRLYLVQDYQQTQWQDHKYMRLDLNKDPLRFTLDLSNVPCGCLACVYMVKMKDPAASGSQYCGMRPARNRPRCRGCNS